MERNYFLTSLIVSQTDHTTGRPEDDRVLGVSRVSVLEGWTVISHHSDQRQEDRFRQEADQ